MAVVIPKDVLVLLMDVFLTNLVKHGCPTLASMKTPIKSKCKLLASQDIHEANVSQMWGILLLVLVMGLSPILMIMAKNAISSIQVSTIYLVRPFKNISTIFYVLFSCLQ